MNLSYSSLEILHTCPRKFELEKILPPEGLQESSLDLIVGKSAHAGIQHSLAGYSLERAVWEAYKEYSIIPQISIEECITKKGNVHKSFHHVVMHVQKFQENLPDELQGFSLAWIKNQHGVIRPAIEVGFRIRLPGGYYYRGYIDAILTDGVQYVALEIKTTGFENANPALWHNSFQGMSYAMIVDLLSGQANALQIFLALEFPKLGQNAIQYFRSAKDKQSWLPSLAMDVQAINLYRKHQHFPMRGASCFNFFRPCPHLGICNLPRPVVEHSVIIEDSIRYDYDFELQELLNFAENECNGNYDQVSHSKRLVSVDRNTLEECPSV